MITRVSISEREKRCGVGGGDGRTAAGVRARRPGLRSARCPLGDVTGREQILPRTSRKSTALPTP